MSRSHRNVHAAEHVVGEGNAGHDPVEGRQVIRGLLRVALLACCLVDSTRAADAPLSTPILAMTEDLAAPVIVQTDDGRPVMTTYYDLTARGLAFFGPHVEARLGGGSYRAERIGEHVAAMLTKGGALTFAMLIEPDGAQPEGACLAAYAVGKEAPQIAVTSSGAGLRIAVGGTAMDAPCAAGLHHVLFTAGGGSLAVYVDGTAAGSVPLPTLPTWANGVLRLGNDAQAAHPWRGMIAGAALYNRAATPGQAAALARASLERHAAHPPIPRIAMSATLLARSQFEEPEYVAYNKAYVLCDYRVESVTAGSYDGKTIRVAQWVFLGRKLLTTSTREIGQRYDLLLEPMAAHPELADEQAYDTLEADPDRAVFWDVAPVAYAPPQPVPAEAAP